MAHKLREIYNILGDFAPLHLAESWDNPGLQVGSFSLDVEKIFVSLDPTPASVKEAVLRKAQLLLTHHPLIFRSLSQIDHEIYPGTAIQEAIKADIAIITAHTNLDAAKGGLNDLLARILDLRGVKVLKNGEENGEAFVGIGRIGFLNNTSLLRDVITTVKGSFKTKSVRVVGQDSMRIKCVAIVGGSGGDFISLAAQKGADVLITGDVSHHQALTAENLAIGLIDAGHFSTEKVAMSLFANQLRDILVQKGLDLIVENYAEERDPMRYE